METQEKKIWEAPKVQILSVKEITLSGDVYAENEGGGKDKPGPQGLS
jgi:hypothetical protein